MGVCLGVRPARGETTVGVSIKASAPDQEILKESMGKFSFFPRGLLEEPLRRLQPISCRPTWDW
jgi:hypothetical protein